MNISFSFIYEDIQ